MIELDEEHEPIASDDETLAELIDRITRRLESGERIDPALDIPRAAAHAGRLRALMPMIRDLVDLGRSFWRPAVGNQMTPNPGGDARGANPSFLVTEFSPDA